jgi:FliI/YscN family ATPase
VGDGLRGRIIDALGQPLDGLGPIAATQPRTIDAEPPDALSRPRINQVLETGIKAIDTLYTLGRGQRLGIFAGSGVGKSVLLGELAKHARADLNVIALVGERGREVGEFIERNLGPEGLARSVVIVATSDRPAVERMLAAVTAHAVAEHFRDQGQEVLLMMDSLTRYCHAARDIGLAAGEPPTVRGYPPSAFAGLPRLLERAGRSPRGGITALYTVLVDGDDESEPVADNARAILDGHLFLSRRLAGLGLYPAIDPQLSVSRLIADLASPEDWRLALEVRELWGEYERVRDLVEIGAYQAGADPRVDRAIACHPRLREFVAQPMGRRHTREESLQLLRTAIGSNGTKA